MACANSFITILALLTFAFTVWPGWGGETATKWVVGLSMLFIILTVWTGMECKCTRANEPVKAASRAAPKKTTKRRGSHARTKRT